MHLFKAVFYELFYKYKKNIFKVHMQLKFKLIINNVLLYTRYICVCVFIIQYSSI